MSLQHELLEEAKVQVIITRPADPAIVGVLHARVTSPMLLQDTGCNCGMARHVCHDVSKHHPVMGPLGGIEKGRRQETLQGPSRETPILLMLHVWTEAAHSAAHGVLSWPLPWQRL